MHRPHVRTRLLLFGALILPWTWPSARVVGAETPHPDGRELFTREWAANDPRSRAGDGLGPVFNGRSCLGCHHQGGAGGAAGIDRNIDIVTAAPLPDRAPATGGGPFYSFHMSFGGEGFQYKVSNGAPAKPPKTDPLATIDPAELALIHPGFRGARSLVLHRFATDPDYPLWRERIPGKRDGFAVKISQRNPSPLFGMGAIEAISDETLQNAARRRFAGAPQIKGRVSHLPDGRVGRFGWKAQTATLAEFILSAAAVEIGLEVPGHHQAGDPRRPDGARQGLDMDQADCDALIDYVRELPPPLAREPSGPRESVLVKEGKSVFKSIGCANCHTPKLGDVEGIYSDLLLHDMSPRLGDTGFYSAFVPRQAGDAAAAKGPGGVGAATVQEWRTPPLWGLRDSAPYLHDGRAESVEQAIALHGGQGSDSARQFAKLTPRERRHLAAFLDTLAAPPAADGP